MGHTEGNRHRSKKDCKPCNKRRSHHKEGDCDKDEYKPKCPPCPKPETPESTLLGILEPVEQPNTEALIAEAIVNLSATPQFRPEWNVCDERKVCVNSRITLVGGATAQVISFGAGVKYDSGDNQYYDISMDCPLQPVAIAPGETKTLTFSFCTKLNKDRILYIYARYFTGSTPAVPDRVTYAPPEEPNVIVTVFNENAPAKHH